MKKVILYNEFHIDFSRSYEEQADSLNEDLFQMDFGDDRLLDIGWYPETMFKDGIKLTIRWFLENEEWMKNVTSGDYQKYYQEMYK